MRAAPSRSAPTSTIRRHRPIEAGESIPVRLSHVVINSPKPDETRAFYERHLGFRLSDTLMHPRMGDMMWFMRINAWHHSLAIARGPHPSLHHASFEMRDIDSYMRGTGRLLRAGVEKIWGPGRHMAGNNTFSYFLDPHGNTIEYTTELETDRRGHLAPAPVRLHPARGVRPVGDREPDERVRRLPVVQRRRQGPVRGPAGLTRESSCDSPPTSTPARSGPGSSPTSAAAADGASAAGRDDRAGPGDRAGLPAALAAGAGP